MFDSSRKKFRHFGWGIAALALSVVGFMAPATASAQMSGAIFTTNAACDGTNVNIYSDRQDVYLDGGPRKAGSAGLPDGNYYVKVTDPSGQTLLGSTTTASVVVSGGEFAQCYQLWAILTQPDSSPGYALTPNNGGEYKVWASQDSGFPSNATKTDNFKVKEDGGGPPLSEENLLVQKFYDANANGVKDGTETFIIGWKVNIAGCIDQDALTPFSGEVDLGLCTVREYMPSEPNWVRTLPSATDTITVTVVANQTAEVLFGNVCLGEGGGKTLGFWSNKNGQALVSAADLAALSALNLRDAAGNHFDPATNEALRTWLLGGNATNMAYMLSVQLAAMQLNVYEGFVDGTAMIHAPGIPQPPANSAGFASVNDIMAEANTSLHHWPLTLSGHAHRAHQEALKNALDAANNNMNFVQPTACPFTAPWEFATN
jgi:hypothetical protein